MSADSDLEMIALQMESLESRFVDSRQLGLHLSTEDEAEFWRLAIEAKSILSDALGPVNDFSTNIGFAVSSGSGGLLGGPSLASVKTTRAIVKGGINQIRRRPTSARTTMVPKLNYVDPSRLAQLRAKKSSAFDLTRLIEELNVCYEHECHMAVAMLVRSVTDHIPPIFGCRNFSELANNYQGARSFKNSMEHLDKSLRNIADSHLHVQIRSAEALPTGSQVDFRAALDVLLAEAIRVLK